MDNRPKQLEIRRKKHYDKLYPRQPQLMKRLFPFLNKSILVEKYTEPFLYSPNDPLKNKLKEPKLNRNIKRGMKVKKGKREEYKKELSKFSHSRKLQKKPTSKKISDVRPDVLWGLSMPTRKKKRRGVIK